MLVLFLAHFMASCSLAPYWSMWSLYMARFMAITVKSLWFVFYVRLAHTLDVASMCHCGGNISFHVCIRHQNRAYHVPLSFGVCEPCSSIWCFVGARTPHCTAENESSCRWALGSVRRVHGFEIRMRELPIWCITSHLNNTGQGMKPNKRSRTMSSTMRINVRP